VTAEALLEQALGAGFSLAASVKSIDSLQFQSAHQLLAAVVVDIGEEAQDLAGNVSARRERDVSVDGSRQAAQASQSLGFLGCGHFPRSCYVVEILLALNREETFVLEVGSHSRAPHSYFDLIVHFAVLAFERGR